MHLPEHATTACDHLVQFYESEDELVRAVVPFLAAGLDADEALLVIATAPHRLAFERELAAIGTGLEAAIAAGTYVAIDAAEILHYLQEDAGGQIHAADFDATAGMLVRRLLAGGRRLRAFGEIVGLLWDRGDTAGAIALEALWNDLRQQHPFTLLCGYPLILEPAHRAAVPDICRAHASVLPAVAEASQPTAPAFVADFTPTIEAPRRARAMLRAKLADLQFSEDLIERLTLAASELAANAVLHARTPFRLRVQPRAASIWVGVEDRDPLTSPLDVVGRSPHGLGLLAVLALRWGVIPGEAGKTIWAEIPQ
jgi:hypothetical protein